MEIVDLVIDTLSLLTVAADILIVVGIIILASALFNKNYKGLRKNKLVYWIGERGILLSFIVALVATLGSLFLSEIAGFEPCKLCWYQRIFMYPLVILFGIALEKRDKSIVPYGIVFSGIGALIAAFHYYLQLVPTTPLVPCSTVGIAVSCTTREFTHFGYVTIPMMALTAFLLVIGALMASRIVSNKK